MDGELTVGNAKTTTDNNFMMYKDGFILTKISEESHDELTSMIAEMTMARDSYVRKQEKILSKLSRESDNFETARGAIEVEESRVLRQMKEAKERYDETKAYIRSLSAEKVDLERNILQIEEEAEARIKELATRLNLSDYEREEEQLQTHELNTFIAKKVEELNALASDIQRLEDTKVTVEEDFSFMLKELTDYRNWHDDVTLTITALQNEMTKVEKRKVEIEVEAKSRTKELTEQLQELEKEYDEKSSKTGSS